MSNLNNCPSSGLGFVRVEIGKNQIHLSLGLSSRTVPHALPSGYRQSLPVRVAQRG